MFKKFIVPFLFLVLTLMAVSVSAQANVIEVQCGDIVQNEIEVPSTPGLQTYSLELGAGDIINFVMEPISPTANTYFDVLDKNRSNIHNPDWGAGAGQPDSVSDLIVPSTGTYQFVVGANVATAYTVYFGCVIDGIEVAPGSAAPNTVNNSNGSPATVVVPTFNYGFVGATPVNFGNGVTIPLTQSSENIGSLTPGFEGIFGYQFTATQGQKLDLTFRRVEGSLNLGIAIIAQEGNTLAFQSSLLATESMIVSLRLPATGTYTIGVYRFSGDQPADAQQTTFGITAIVSN